MAKIDHSSSPDHRPDFWKPNTPYSAPKGQWDPGYDQADYSWRGTLRGIGFAILLLIFVIGLMQAGHIFLGTPAVH